MVPGRVVHPRRVYRHEPALAMPRELLVAILERLGAIEIPRTEYLRRLQDDLRNPASFADK